MLSPLYTADNVKIAYELRWSLSLFWNEAAIPSTDWLPQLQEVTEPDGVRILDHRLTQSNVSQFLISTKPQMSPSLCIRSVKGRLQYLVRESQPKAFRRNYTIISIGEANKAAVEGYVAGQLQHHPMVDPRIEAILAPYQFMDRRLNLALPRRSSYGQFVYNLHFVTVHQRRLVEIDEDYFRKTSAMVSAIARKKNQLISRIGLLADHIHWTVGCNIDESPLEVGLSYLNNIAFAHAMKLVFQNGFFVGTFGPYDMKSVRWHL
jgi:REP element-mobilizing transposase RayT